jgi:hypothetical protein
MSQSKNSVDEREFASAAANQYINARGLAFEDARLGLKYMLLRLSLLGLSNEDQKQLHKLARLAFADADVTEEADRIKDRKTASPLAIAIAGIVASAPEKKPALLGAVSGSYAGLNAQGSKFTRGIVGAVAGAVTLSTNDFVVRAHIDMNHFLEAK